MLTGNVAGECKAGHNSTDFIGFLKKPDTACEQGKAPHVIIDNHSAHKPEETKRIRRESRESVKRLVEAIKSFIEGWNRSGRVFTWTKPADKIRTSVAKAKQAYNAA
jgi:hypothetical protein